MNKRVLKHTVLLIPSILLLFFISRKNFLFFHVSLEFGRIIIGGIVFVIYWVSRRKIAFTPLIILGIGYPLVGIMDFLHTISYKGMNIFPVEGADMATQYWIATRYFEAGLLLTAFIIAGRPVKTLYMAAGMTAVCTLLVGIIAFTPYFPVCYDDINGLTPFKRASELVICCLFVTGTVFLLKHRDIYTQPIRRYMFLSMLFSIAAELLFSVYISVFGISNVLGHIAKVIANYFIYVSFIRTAIVEPQELQFRELKDLNMQLQESLDTRDILEKETHHRIKNNIQLLTALISLESQDNPGCEEVFSRILGRLDTIGRIHDKLSHTTPSNRIDASDYIQDLVGSLYAGNRTMDWRIDVDVEPITISSKHLVPIGMILSELCMNSFKHSEGLQSGTIAITLRRDDGIKMTYSAATAAVRIPDSRSSNGLGAMLVEEFTRQLEGSYTVHLTDGTLTYDFRFPPTIAA